MMKKLGIVVMAGLFSISVAGLSFADEKPHGTAAPAATAAPVNPCAGKGDKPAKKAAKKAAKKGEAPAAAAAPAPGPAPTPAPTPAKK